MMRTAYGLRLLLALTLMGWGQVVFAEDYTWGGYGGAPFSSPTAAADSLIVGIHCRSTYRNCLRVNGRFPSPSKYLFDLQYEIWDFNGTEYTWMTYVHSGLYTDRLGNGCTEPKVYNPATAGCETPPQNCAALKEQTFNFFAKVPNGEATLPGEYVCYQGCRAIWGGRCAANDKGESACFGLATYNGDACQPSDSPAGIGAPPTEPTAPTEPTVPPPDPVDPADPTDPEDPADPTDPTDPTDPADPADPTDPTDPSDPRDPTDPGSPGDPNAPSTPSEPGEPGDGDQEKIGEKIDETNSLLDGIFDAVGNLGDIFEEFSENALGEQYDGSGDSTDSSIGDEAKGLSNNLLDLFNKGMNSALETQAAADEAALAELPNTVANAWFGPGSVAYSAIHLIDGVLPRSTSCSAFDIRINAGELRTNLRLDACELSRIKPLLEWVVWMGTIIGVWRIAYAGLRLENAKADRGGF